MKKIRIFVKRYLKNAGMNEMEKKIVINDFCEGIKQKFFRVTFYGTKASQPEIKVESGEIESQQKRKNNRLYI